MGKPVFRGLQPGKIQTDMLRYGGQLESWKFRLQQV